MKKIFPFLFLAIALTQSCIIITEPRWPSSPPQTYPGGQPWVYNTDDDNNETDNDTQDNGTNSNTNSGTSNGSNGNSNNSNQDQTYVLYPGENPEALKPGFIPTCKYETTYVDGILTFNVYLGWSIDRMETIIPIYNFPKCGGEIVFNIYTNNRSMLMYEFKKYLKHIYEFSSEPPYCGYSSYSLDIRPICKYKLIVKENNTNSERDDCHGYWSCNLGGFYSKFGINLYQCF